MVTQNFTRQPTFFGCNATQGTPLVLYLPNSPWLGYTNFSFLTTSFTNNQLDLTLDNAFQLATYGNGAVDPDWPACLACAVVKASLERLDVDLPGQCRECFDRHCWDRRESDEEVTEADLDPRLRLRPGVTFEEWNRTEWFAKRRHDRGRGKHGGHGGRSGAESAGRIAQACYKVLFSVAVAMFML